jgi:hypothetical protein
MSDDKSFYSKRNPCGPYAGTVRPGKAADKPSDHIEGFSTKKNLSEWEAYSKRNSDDPKITGNKLK